VSIVPVIMSGGVGTRLWPLSRRLSPKQFHKLGGDRTMIQATVQRLDGLAGFSGPLVVASISHVDEIRRQLQEVDREPSLVIGEPEGRNTAAAIAVAALSVDPDDVLVVLPADHVIDDVEAFHQALEVAIGAAASDRLVTFGVVPTRPATGYGYIRASGSGRIETVEEFVEKPDLETARRYVASDGYRWNSGMFVFPVAALIEEMERFCPAILDGVRHALGASEVIDGVVLLSDDFSAVTAVSIDHAVMEHTDRATVVSLDAGWNDVGSWDALWEIGRKDSRANVVEGDAVLHDVTGSYVRAENRTVAVIGLSDVVVVETEDAVLVAPRERAEEVKALVDGLGESGRPHLT
jgi:mannose-1-phosphate guanylyltransferase/mannose-6-phosphate isomerase